jgi:hypothetical protein
MIKDWIVITGSLVDTTEGGGFEFHGPFTEAQAQTIVADYKQETDWPMVQAVQLLATTFKAYRDSGDDQDHQS